MTDEQAKEQEALPATKLRAISLGLTFSAIHEGYFVDGNLFSTLFEVDIFLDGALAGQRAMRDMIVRKVHQSITGVFKGGDK